MAQTRSAPYAAAPTLNFSQLKALWEKHATGPATAPGVSTVAAAIALAESGGRPVVNSIGATSYWQIHPGGPQYIAPDANAAAAVAKYNGARSAGRDGFTPWTTYTGYDTPGHEKTYKKYLPKNGVDAGDIAKGALGPLGPAAGIIGGAITSPFDTAKGVVDATTAIPKFLGKLGSAIFSADWWLRVGLVLGGIVAILLGIYMIGTQFLARPVAQIASKLPIK